MIFRIVLVLLITGFWSNTISAQANAKEAKSFLAEIRSSINKGKLEQAKLLIDSLRLNNQIDFQAECLLIIYEGAIANLSNNYDIAKEKFKYVIDQEKKHKSDSLMAIAFLCYGRVESTLLDFESSQEYIQKCYKRASENNWSTLTRESLRKKIANHLNLSDYDQAKTYLDTLLNFSKTNQDTSALIAYHNYNVQLNLKEKNLAGASKSAMQAIRIGEESDIKLSLLTAYHRMVYIYFNIRNHEKAKEYIHKKRRIHRVVGQADSVMLINLHLNQGNLDSAKLGLGGLKTNLKKERPWFTKYHKHAIEGYIYELEGKTTRAINEYKNLLPVSDSTNTKFIAFILVDGLYNLASIYFDNSNYAEALNICESQAASHGLGNKKRFWKLKADILAKLGKNESALLAMQQYSHFSDSLTHVYNSNLILAEENTYNELKEQQQINMLKSEKDLAIEKTLKMRTLILALIMGIVLLSLLFLYINRYKKISLEKDLIDTKQQLINRQLNPHFIFNSLNSIQNSVLKSDKESSAQLISDFSSLTRKILSNSEQISVNLFDEIDLLKNYLDLEKQRNKDKFDYQISIDDQIDIYNEEIPGMILQLFVENAIWHGIMPAETKGLITIHIYKENRKLYVSIKDNGVGYQKSLKKKSQAKRKSFGLKLIEERLRLLNQKEDKDMSFEINENKGENGTTVKIAL